MMSFNPEIFFFFNSWEEENVEASVPTSTEFIVENHQGKILSFIGSSLVFSFLFLYIFFFLS